MKIRHKFFSILLSTAVIFSTFAIVHPTAPPESINRTIPIATCVWPPHINASATDPGDLKKRMDRILATMGLSPEYHYYPWERCLMLTRRGSVAATFPFYWTEQHQRDFLISDPIISLRQILLCYSRDGATPDIKNLSDLKRCHVGTVIGYEHTAAFKKHDIQVSYANNEIEVLHMLKTGVIDIASLESANARFLIDQHFSTEKNRFHIMPSPLRDTRLCLLISKKHEDPHALLLQFNNALKEISSAENASASSAGAQP